MINAACTWFLWTPRPLTLADVKARRDSRRSEFDGDCWDGEENSMEGKDVVVMESVLGVKRILRGPLLRLVLRGKIATEERDMDGNGTPQLDDGRKNARTTENDRK